VTDVLSPPASLREIKQRLRHLPRDRRREVAAIREGSRKRLSAMRRWQQHGRIDSQRTRTGVPSWLLPLAHLTAGVLRFGWSI
jgi:hypothetical protein